MNNRRLLTGLLSVFLSGNIAYLRAQSPQPITIEELFDIAENNSVQLRQSFTAEEEARRSISVSRAERLPDIETSISLSYIGDGFTTSRSFTDYQKAPIPHFGNTLSLSVTQPIYTGGAITAGIELSEHRLTASHYATELQRDNLRFSITGYYLDLYKCTNLLEVVDSNILLARQVLDEMTTRFENGTALHNDITRYELMVSNLELQRLKIKNTLEILNHNLVITAGMPEGTQILPDSTLLDRTLPGGNEEWWQTVASANAPSLKLANSGIDMSRKAEKIARSAMLPHIGVQAGWTADGPILVEVPPINRNLSYWYVGIGVKYNLSSLFKDNKSISKRRAATVNAIANYDAAKENVELAVRDTYIRYMEAYEELKTQQKSVELAESNYDITFTRYSAGMALITDMLDASKSLLEAQQNLVNSRINIIYNYYKLLFTSGKI